MVVLASTADVSYGGSIASITDVSYGGPNFYYWC